MGLEKKDQGRSMISFLSWVGRRLLLQEAALLQDSVPGFPTVLLAEFFEATYYSGVATDGTASLGFPVRRARRWSLLCHHIKQSATGRHTMPSHSSTAGTAHAGGTSAWPLAPRSC